MINQADYRRYKKEYEAQEAMLSSRLIQLAQLEQEENILERPWIASLLKHGKLTELDRTTMAETVKEILVFEDRHIEISYLFSDELGILSSMEENR